MENFVKHQNLQKGTISYIASLFSTTEHRKDLEKQFMVLDKNKDGKISFEEMKHGFQITFGEQIKDEQLKQLFKAVDTDNSGFIDYSEFISATIDANQFLTIDKLEKLFKSIDKDGSGSISINELRLILQSVKRGSEIFINELINYFAETSQTEIRYKEFVQMINNEYITKNQGQNYTIIKSIFSTKKTSKNALNSQGSILNIKNMKLPPLESQRNYSQQQKNDEQQYQENRKESIYEIQSSQKQGMENEKKARKEKGN